MVWTIIEGIAGVLLALATLRDLFDTVVVPGRTRGVLQVSRRLVRTALPLARRSRGRGIGANFAPIVLGGAFVIWMVLLVLGFGLIVHALSDSFEPPLKSFGHALYVAGGAMATIGFGSSEARGWAASAVVIGGFCGLAAMTMAVTYLLEIQSNTAHRDVGVLKITTTAGQPPSSLALFERYAALGSRDHMAALLREGRDWCAIVLQSHSTHPWLVYFRSVGTGSGWPAALGALMDVSLIAEMLVDEPQLRGPGVLAREEGTRLCTEITKMLGLEPVHEPVTREIVDRLCARLTAAGYKLREDRDVGAFIAARDMGAARVRALARHLGTREAPLVPS